MKLFTSIAAAAVAGYSLVFSTPANAAWKFLGERASTGVKFYVYTEPVRVEQKIVHYQTKRTLDQDELQDPFYKGKKTVAIVFITDCNGYRYKIRTDVGSPMYHESDWEKISPNEDSIALRQRNAICKAVFGE